MNSIYCLSISPRVENTNLYVNQLSTTTNYIMLIQVWWTKSGKKLPQESFRIRQIHNHHKENEFVLKIRGMRTKDFGEYECNVYSNQTRIQRSAALNVTGISNNN